MDIDQEYINYVSFLNGKILNSSWEDEKPFLVLNYRSHMKTDVGYYDPIRYDIYYIKENIKTIKIFYWYEINEMIKINKSEHYEIIC